MKNYKELSRVEFDRQASFYDKSNAANISKYPKECYPFILNMLRDRDYGSLLDMGCGTGAVLERISKENPKAFLFGLDLSENMVKEAKAKDIPNAEFIIGDAENLPYESERFDVVICNQSFHHYPNPQKAFNEVYRVLKKTGIFILCDMYCNKFLRTIENSILLKLVNTGDVKTYSSEEVVLLLSKAGFKEVSWKKATKMTFISYGIKA